MGKFVSKAVNVLVSPLSLIDKDLGRAVAAIGLTVAGVVTGNFALISAGISMGASLLTPKPKAPNTSGATTDRLQASVNLRTPRTFVAGATAMATDVRDQEWATDQSTLDRFIVCASHRIRGYREIWFDDKLAWTSAGGVTSTYAGYLTVNAILEGSAANAIVTSSRMGATRRYTGCAYIRLRYKLTGNSKKTESPFAGGSIPTRMTIVGDGIPVPDSRASGFNPADQNTWSTVDSACRNPALVMLAYLLGWRINGKLAVGKGIPPARLDLASFATAANVCDEPVTRPNGTTEPRYRCDGIFSEGDETSLVLDNLKATMNAVLDDVDGKIRLSVLYNDLATPIGSLTTADVLGEYTWDQTAPLSDSVNVIRGAYTDPSTASLYQMVDYPEVRIASTDGIDRVQTINLPLVQSAGQAQRLAKLRLARFQFGGTFTAVFQATAWKFQKGDAIRFSFYPLGWNNKLFRIADMTIQVDGTVPMMLREEDPAIYAAYSDETAAVQGAAPTVYDPQQWPIIQGIIDLDAQIARAVSDGWLDPSEKRQARIDYEQRTAQRDALQQRYVDLGSPASVTSVRDNAFAKTQDLFNYLQGLSPSWLDYTTQTQVPDPAGYQAAWKASSDALEVFSAAITGIEGPPGKDGASAVNLISRGSVTVKGNSAVKSGSASGDWESDVYSDGGFLNGATASFRGVGNQSLMAGLNSDPATNQSFTSIDYAWFLSSDGRARIYESGAPVIRPGVPDDTADTYVFGYGEGLFTVDYDDRYVRYLYNGALSRIVEVGSGKFLYFDSSFATPGAQLNQISFTARGSSAPLVITQWSIDGVSNWHDNYMGADLYYRQSNDGGATYGPAIRGVGEDGDNGRDPSIVFHWSTSVPATPAQNSGNPPPGWTDGPSADPGDGSYLFLTKAVFLNGVQQTAWSAPQRISGPKGDKGDQGANGASNTSATTFNGTPGTLVPPGATVTLETSVQVVNNGASGQFRVELYRQMQGGGSIVVQGVTRTIAAGGDSTFNLSGTYTNNTAANVFLQGAASAFRVSDGSNVGGQGYVRIY